LWLEEEGLKKIKDAIYNKANVYLVHEEWFRQSTYHWKRLDEKNYCVMDFTDQSKEPIVCPIILGEEPNIPEPPTINYAAFAEDNNFDQEDEDSEPQPNQPIETNEVDLNDELEKALDKIDDDSEPESKELESWEYSKDSDSE